MNKVFACKHLPDGYKDSVFDFGAVVVAETEKEAKEILLKRVNNAGLQTDTNGMELIEVDINQSYAILIDPNGEGE